jgi:dipeptidyl aminopeptidase/acylaminoacyl peptidase
MHLKQRIGFLFVALWILAGITLGVTAQDDPGLAFAAVQDGQPTVFGLGETPLVIDPTPNTAISSLIWSPDGNLLAYILIDEQFQRHVYVANVTTGAAPVMLNTGALVSGTPINFTNDGQLLYVGQNEPAPDAIPPYLAELKRIAPSADAQPETLGTFEFGIGCGVASIPGYWKYLEEAGYGGSVFALEMTDYGLLHSFDCTGSGIALLNLESGKDVQIGPDPTSPDRPLGHAVLSPDGKTVAALESYLVEGGHRPAHSLALVELSTLAITDVATTAQPDQVAWSKDGATLFYSAHGQPYNVQSQTYTIYIHQLNLTTGEDTLLYSAEAFAIGRMAAAPDGQHLIASQVDGYLNVVLSIYAIVPNQTLTPANDPVLQRYSRVPVMLYRIPLLTREAPLLIDLHLTQFTLRPTRQ